MAEQQKKEFTTALSQWSNEVTGLVRRDYESVGVTFDEYSRTCAMNVMTSIFHLVQQTAGRRLAYLHLRGDETRGRTL